MAVGDGASSISVAVRVRPFTIREAAQLTKTDDGHFFLGEGSLAGAPPKLSQKGLRSIIKVVDDRCLVFDPPEDNPVQRFSRSVVPAGKKTKDQTFVFDKVFDENITQGDVYEATTKGLLDNVFDGYNATVFAYGATGCGKTHTITGTAQQPGIIFLTMQEMFERIAEVQQDKVTEVSLSYLEIYNETIRDLLVPGGSKTGLMLREDAHQAVSVAGLSSHQPRDVNEVMDMIVRGNEYRTMSPTEANATSSRSHAVLQINVSQKDRNADVNEPHTMATLSIIDLAGSERASATKNRGERLLEGANINKSLLALGSCINALCDPRKRNHVPYRNSKLTRLLKFSLGGNCKTVMIVCVSPSSQHFDESQNTLRYANRAKNIQTKVTRNVFNVDRHVKDFLKKIDEQMTLINELKEQQKEYEAHAFAKFRKANEKKDIIVKEGIARLRSAYDNCVSIRNERMSHVRKLRQIEKRITMLDTWSKTFDRVCENREDTEPSKTLVNMRKQAQGITVELEQSRHHYHQKLAKDNWARAIDNALQTGIEQLENAECDADGSETSTLKREAELLKLNGEKEFDRAVMDYDKIAEVVVTEALLHAHFETISIINELVCMDEEEAVAAGREILDKMMKACSDAVCYVVKPDGPAPVVEQFPPTKSGTPKKRRHTSLIAPSPLKSLPLQLPEPVAVANRLSISPMKLSPKRRITLNARRGVSFSPKKKSPTRRSVRWRDDDGGELAESSNTPVKFDTTPDSSSIERLDRPSLPPTIQEEVDAQLNDSNNSSSPIPAPPQTSIEIKPRFDRFQAGFLSKPKNGSVNSALGQQSSSPIEPSPLSEINANNASSRLSNDNATKAPVDMHSTDVSEEGSASESENQWASSENAAEIGKAIRRASLARSNSARDPSRAQRRRSPPASSSPANASGGLFTASHARRMVKNDREGDWKPTVLSPKATPVLKTGGMPGRRMTMSIDSSTPRSSGMRFSSASGIGSAHRTSMSVGSKSGWR